MSWVLFHVMKYGQPIVTLKMMPDGTSEVLGEPGDFYRRVVEPHLDIWFGQNASQPKKGVSPGEAKYPRRLAEALTRDEVLSLWAYVTQPIIRVSLQQVAHAMGRRPGESLRDELREKGLKFTSNPSQTALGSVERVLGSEIANRVVLYPQQIAGVLGVDASNVKGIVERLGIALPRDDIVVAEWEKLRRVRRVGPRKFVLE